MTITLIIEHSPNAQAETSRRFSGGQLVIGRGEDCDWRLDDPDQFVSRKHCIITDQSGEPKAVDASSGGLFVDGADAPLGPGNEVRLDHQMRLRMGDIVIRVEMADTTASASPVSNPVPEQRGNPFDFGTPEPQEAAPAERPDTLPDPFGLKPGVRSAAADRPKPDKAIRPLDQSDPFELNLNKSSSLDQTTPSPAGGSSYFDDFEVAKPTAEPEEVSEPAQTIPVPPIEVTLEPAHSPAPAQPPQPKPVGSQADMIAALYRGMGLDEALAEASNPEEMEAIGARFRELVDGVMYLLRTRAQEKQNIRAAQTIIANTDVNPLKFLASPEEASLALIRGRDQSYLSGDKAIPAAYRDLADHQVRTWQALQTALRRMIDRFDPQEIERDMDETGLLETIVAGGRSAKMWQIYQDRYRDIAEAAEKRFLGEVGADFRDAYESERK